MRHIDSRESSVHDTAPKQDRCAIAMTILYAGDASETDQWLGAVREIDPGLTFRHWPDTDPVDDIDFIIVGGRMPGDFSPFKNLRGIQSTWAGVSGHCSAPCAAGIRLHLGSGKLRGTNQEHQGNKICKRFHLVELL